MKTFRIVGLALVLATPAGAVYAQPGEGMFENLGEETEAMTKACEGNQAGQVCSYNDPRRNGAPTEGTCLSAGPDAGNKLMCFPGE